jgi:hypothetical protein
MERHVFILSTMTPALTNAALAHVEIETQEGTIQKYRWDEQTTLWIACQHPVVKCLAESILPYMDKCVCWYHNHCSLSCLRVDNCITFLEKYHSNISLMTTVNPVLSQPHQSKVKKYYNKHGFLINYYKKNFRDNLHSLLC